MKNRILAIVGAAAISVAPRAAGTCFQFTEEHVDLLGVLWNSSSNQLSLMASDDSHGLLYASNQCVIICPESMKFSLPGGTPLGNEGAPLWILPQNRYDRVPYVGASAEQIASGVFNDPFTIRLTRMEGPGQFLLWQTGSFGDYSILMDTRDGISAADALTIPVGGHAHFNWGFTTNGIYRLYFQVSGALVGQTTNTVSPETPFTFHILPLHPFENWTATNWPCECATNIIGPGADPDGDKAANAFEYATGGNPKTPDTNARPVFSFVITNGQTYGAITYNHLKMATDAACEVVAGINLSLTNRDTLTNTHAIVDQGDLERVTVRDNEPATNHSKRFFQLRVVLP